MEKLFGLYLCDELRRLLQTGEVAERLKAAAC
jgi:hypothetical protein